MIALVPILCLGIGICTAYLMKFKVDGQMGQYLAVACLAGMDSVLGGIRAGIEKNFQNDIFITGFLGNVLFSFLIAWLGDRIYINLFVVVALIMGGRIFTNLTLIRRYLIGQYKDWVAKRKSAEPTPVTNES